ncbi:MAG: hypothetical protein VX941_08625 [Pseudomonadota bacterium]|nr:hypothetical protein [Pseudomonadota bacterium]
MTTPETIQTLETDIAELRSRLAGLNGEREVVKSLALKSDQPMAELVGKRIEIREAIQITEERLAAAENRLASAVQTAALEERKRTRDSVCALTDSMLAETHKLEAAIKRGARHYKKVLDIEKEIRALAPAAEGLPPEFLHASPGGRLYEFLITALSKHFALSNMTINKWPTQIHFEQKGTPELAFAPHLQLNEEWRNPSCSEVENADGWREATEEEMTHVPS